ncbi:MULTISPECIES: helix-turn-helix domain-containing protein [unclassified Streptomyces]|uniref:helix-turn-helix domain-containing protein n=1 Tax=unclassified Streptomyces TaxID=2593676 RepID=UPI002254C2F7|nr:MULTISPECIES: helix-turn-helix transcriptional regulator [unclassified Streptomyces]MCX4863431.1 helix-turn-helix transcriptional regulator [Streptomyces sp. NBC_00906]MCX4894668.1 helix-turn-helix transcriptional regulator [Streptomyces sp. NBC_00892]
METGRIGRRIAYWRERRGFTQADFGRLMGQTRRWVQDLEGGQRQQDPRLSVLVRAAEVLRIPLEQLLMDRPSEPPPATTPPVEVLAVIDVLYRHDDDGDASSLGELRRRLTYCCEAFQACHYGALGRDLPALIVMARQSAARASVEAGEAHALLSRVLQLTASFLHKYGPATAVQAAVVADRALAAAERSGDAVAIGAASRRVAKSLTYQQQPRAAVDFAIGAARRLSTDLEASGPLGLSTLGMLYLNAAIAASSLDRSADAVRQASDHVDQAAEVADQQGADLDEDYTMFGPTNVGLHRVDVLTRFEDGWSAIEAADGLESEALYGLSKERQAQHLITMARAQLLTRRKETAAASLIEAVRLAPEEVIGRQSTVDLVADVVGATPVPGGDLRRLAARCGLPA